jgi:hypothetical protein
VPVLLARRRGVLDFIERPPFESRNMVWYAEGLFSEVSMARKGFGIWELDFSGYILGLGMLDERGGLTVGAGVGRSSVVSLEKGVVVGDEGMEIKVERERDEERESCDSTPSTEEGEILVETPGDSIVDLRDLVRDIPSVVVELPTPDLSSVGSIVLEVPVAVLEVKAEEPVSSFKSGRQVATWADSDEEESDEDEEEEDVVALAEIPKRPSLSMPIATSSFSRAPAPTHTRSASRPELTISQRQSTSTSTSSNDKHLAAMAEVARARERREANDKGLVERRAESGRRTSMVDLRPTFIDSRKSSSKLPTTETRSRVMSSYDLTNTRQSSKAPSKESSGMGSRRYHSFYEQSHAPLSLSQPQQQQQPQQHVQAQLQQMYTHPAMMAFPQQMGMGYGQMMPAYMMPGGQVMGVPIPYGYAPTPGLGNRSSMVLPNTHRRPPIA